MRSSLEERHKTENSSSLPNKSIMFSPPLKNFHLSGEALNRKIYSSVNHVMQTASTIANSGLSEKYFRSLSDHEQFAGTFESSIFTSGGDSVVVMVSLLESRNRVKCKGDC